MHEWQARGCPTEKGEQAVLAWAMENARRHEPVDIREAKLALLLETSRRLKLANDAKQDITVSKSAVQEVMAKGMSTLFSVLERKFSIELPAGIVGLEAGPIQTKLLATLQEAKHELQRQWGEYVGNGK